MEALLPQGQKDVRDHLDADRARQADERRTAAHADRAQRAGRASVVLTGFLDGSLDGLAVRATPDAEHRLLYVDVETVDPVPFAHATFLGFTFELAEYHGDCTYDFVDDGKFDALQYSLWLEDDNEGWCFHPTYGPGRVVVTDGVAAVSMVFGSAGSERVQLRAQVRLTL